MYIVQMSYLVVLNIIYVYLDKSSYLWCRRVTTGGEDKGRSGQQEEWTARRTTGGAESYKDGY